MKIARINYANAEPFFYDWPHQRFPVHYGVPRELAQLARNGQIMGGPLPLVDCWKMQSMFSPLGSWGIAAAEKSGSVYLLSKKPISELNNITVGVTYESSTSVRLLDVLVREKYGHKIRLKRGIGSSDPAWLVIGDQALKKSDHGYMSQWKFTTDLATEWWTWKNLPFVFALWVVKKDLSDNKKEALRSQVESSLKVGLQSLSKISIAQSRRLNVSASKIFSYLNRIIYHLGPREMKSIALFRNLCDSPAQTIIVEESLL